METTLTNWSDILGHERVRDVLSRAVDSGRLHHAYLFTGPTGIGKHTTAHALAAVLNCDERGDGFAPNCGECRTCRLISGRQHPDVFFVAPPNRVITIDQIRDLQKVSVSAPYEARFRVVLIEDCHSMTPEAANALLKTLEEPPDRMILILVTDQPHRLLDTILSRCQRLRFGTLDRDLISRELPRFVEESEDSNLLEIAAGYGEGSLGRSIAIYESGMLGKRAEFLDKIASLDGNSPRKWLELAAEWSDSAEELEYRIDILTVFLRDVMLAKRASDSRIVNGDLCELVDRFAEQYRLEAVLTTLEALMSARQRLNFHVNKQLLAEDILDRLRDPDWRGLQRPA